MSISKKIEVVQYDSKWADQFNALKSKYEAALGSLAQTIEHVGSTSVPGLAAKPILDIIITIQYDNLPAVINKLATLGYYHNGDQGIQGREVFRLPNELLLSAPRHHLYVCDRNADEYIWHIAYRDYLRSHPVVAKAYATIKLEAARMANNDINIYMDHKGPFVLEYLLKALSWAGKLPQMPSSVCHSCSRSVHGEFSLQYIGDGYKEALSVYHCSTCNAVWRQPYTIKIR